MSQDTLDVTIEKLPFKRYHVFAFANPRSGDGLAARFLTDFPPKNSKQLWFADYKQSVECNFNIYNVLEAAERNKCLMDLTAEIIENDNATRRIVVIMGGDGSFATTLKFLRT